MSTFSDSIERQIDIDAPIGRVWQLVSEPGWWINEGEIREHRLEERDGLTVVHDATHGVFSISTVEFREPTFASFRWEPGSVPGDKRAEGKQTLVEFFLEERPGGVTLKVVESGFAALPLSEEDRVKAFNGNTEGWRIELAAARTFSLADVTAAE
ncbi:ATPase [Pseudarthrobacter albicanus]|uniref:ATPase n=1 Tax=Pseudarthrobacter albicanus TaxID=2823873 RepID=UPI001BA4598A|nr:ATPase [Pseudarthrobacter albicanus]